MELPILYSFRRCPYAIRARMTLFLCQTPVEIREVVLRDKPQAMICISPKATVPVLQLFDNTIIDESLDIIYWALSQKGLSELSIAENFKSEASQLIHYNDNQFKQYLDHYKYADRFPEFSEEYYREQGEDFLQQLNHILENSEFLIANRYSVVDIAIFPFIRQFCFVDKTWFYRAPYKHLQKWLDKQLSSIEFAHIMHKFPQWIEGDPPTRLF